MQNLNFSRDDCLLLSKMAHQTGRSKDMIHFSSKFCNLETELSLEERNTLASAYRLSVCTKREELETLNSIEQSEKKTANKKDLEYIRNYKYTIENELKSLCYEIIRIIDVNLLAHVKEGTESHVFYLKMKGDYYRYLCEIDADENLIERALEAYEEADSVGQDLPITNLVKLGLQLNYSVFYKEILGKLEDAKLIAYEAFELALKDYENTSPENMNECSTLMQLLSDNICLWNLEEKERKEFLK